MAPGSREVCRRHSCHLGGSWVRFPGGQGVSGEHSRGGKLRTGSSSGDRGREPPHLLGCSSSLGRQRRDRGVSVHLPPGRESRLRCWRWSRSCRCCDRPWRGCPCSPRGVRLRQYRQHPLSPHRYRPNPGGPTHSPPSRCAHQCLPGTRPPTPHHQDHPPSPPHQRFALHPLPPQPPQYWAVAPAPPPGE